MEFFDILYLGIFATLSPAFDDRFYKSIKSPPALSAEIRYAMRHFHSILHRFSLRFIVLLEGEAVAHSYIFDRMLAEFAAAAVIFAKGVGELYGDDGNSLEEGAFTHSRFAENIKGILQSFHPEVWHYYSRCLDRHHKHFIWTGPEVKILPRSKEFVSIIPRIMRGELCDLPSHAIYTVDLAPETLRTIPQLGKRASEGEDMDVEGEPAKKRKLQKG